MSHASLLNQKHFRQGRSGRHHGRDIFRCKVVDVSPTELTLELTGDRNKIKAVVALLQRFGVKDFVRAGTVAMRRSMQLAD